MALQEYNYTSQRQQGLAPMTGITRIPYVPAHVVTSRSTSSYTIALRGPP